MGVPGEVAQAADVKRTMDTKRRLMLRMYEGLRRRFHRSAGCMRSLARWRPFRAVSPASGLAARQPPRLTMDRRERYAAGVTPRRWCSAEVLQRRTEAGPHQLQLQVGRRCLCSSRSARQNKPMFLSWKTSAGTVRNTGRRIAIGCRIVRAAPRAASALSLVPESELRLRIGCGLPVTGCPCSFVGHVDCRKTDTAQPPPQPATRQPATNR
jgi:hypothetical protein